MFSISTLWQFPIFFISNKIPINSETQLPVFITLDSIFPFVFTNFISFSFHFVFSIRHWSKNQKSCTQILPHAISKVTKIFHAIEQIEYAKFSTQFTIIRIIGENLQSQLKFIIKLIRADVITRMKQIFSAWVHFLSN